MATTAAIDLQQGLNQVVMNKVQSMIDGKTAIMTCSNTTPSAAQFRTARREMLAISNCYEPRKRKVLRGVYYDRQRGTFRWSGQAHDYTVCVK